MGCQRFPASPPMIEYPGVVSIGPTRGELLPWMASTCPSSTADELADIRNQKNRLCLSRIFNLLSRTVRAGERGNCRCFTRGTDQRVRAQRGARFESVEDRGAGRPGGPHSKPALGGATATCGHRPRIVRTNRHCCWADEPTGNLGQPPRASKIMGVFQKLNDQGDHDRHGHA